MKPKLYLETTIPSLLTAWPSRDVLLAGQQQATRDWWAQRRKRYQLFISGLVLAESRRGDPSAATAREQVLSACAVLEYSEEAQILAAKILSTHLLLAKAAVDAAHIAIARVHQMDFLLTWNCRHIANAFIRGRLRQLIGALGYSAPTICTPEELLQESYEQDNE